MNSAAGKACSMAGWPTFAVLKGGRMAASVSFLVHSGAMAQGGSFASKTRSDVGDSSHDSLTTPSPRNVIVCGVAILCLVLSREGRRTCFASSAASACWSELSKNLRLSSLVSISLLSATYIC